MPFSSFDFSVDNIKLAGCELTVIVKKGWTKIVVDGSCSDKAVFERIGKHVVVFE